MKYIDLSQNKVAKVDDDDYEWLSQYKWHVCKAKNTHYSNTHYYNENGIRSTKGMHRLILEYHNNISSNMMIDHKDGDGLNNQKINLRLCTNMQNQMNRKKSHGYSIFKGVSFHKLANKWQSRITTEYLGLFDNEVDAAKAYDAKARELFGEFALLNFPNSKE